MANHQKRIERLNNRSKSGNAYVDKVSSSLDKFNDALHDLRSWLTHNTLILRTVKLGIAFLMVVTGLTLGFLRINHTNYERAMRVSTTSTALNFSKSGQEIKLRQVYRKGDLTIIPLKYTNSDSVSLNAKNYKVFIKNVGNGRLPNINVSLASFGNSGVIAVVLRGNLPQHPLQVVVRNDAKLTSSSSDTNTDTDNTDGDTTTVTDSGDGQIMLDGRAVDIDYDAISFTVNPKAANVKIGNKISEKMSMADLYYYAYGKSQLDSNTALQKKLKGQITVQENNVSEYADRLARVNVAMGRDGQDLNKTDGESAKSTLAGQRNDLIDKLTTAKTSLASLKKSLKKAQAKRTSLDANIDGMDNFTSLASRYQVIQ